MAMKSKRLEKSLGIKIDSDLYEKIRGVIIEKENKRTRTNEGGGENKGGEEDTFDKPVE